MASKLISTIPNRTARERQQMRSNAVAALTSSDESKRSSAKELLAALDAFEANAADDERMALLNMSLKERIVFAFTKEPPTELEAKMIRALGDPQVNTSTSSLSEEMGWDTWGAVGAEGAAWNLHYGNMCKKREAFIHPADSQYRARGKGDPFMKHYSSLLTDIVESEAGGTALHLKREAVEAFIELGVLGASARNARACREEREAVWRAEMKRRRIEQMDAIRRDRSQAVQQHVAPSEEVPGADH